MGRPSDSRQHLIDAAIELMRARGYGSVGVQELCERAGVKKGSFYYFFPTKADLTLAALDAMWARHREKVLEPALTAPVSTEERLRRLFEQSFDRQGQLRDAHGYCIGCAFGNLAVEISGQDPRIQDRLREIFRQWADALASALAEATGAPAAPQTAELAQALLAYLEGLMLLARAHDDPSLMTRLGPYALRLAGLEPATARVETFATKTPNPTQGSCV